MFDFFATQQYTCVMMPGLVDIDSPWPVLPPGVHDATMGEIAERFAANSQRRRLFAGLEKGIEVLRNAGCKTVYLDGSFITGKPEPEDFDACWVTTGVDDTRLDPVLLDFDNKRQKQKKKFGGEFFPSGALTDGQHTFVEFFQRDTYTDEAKGIIRIEL